MYESIIESMGERVRREMITTAGLFERVASEKNKAIAELVPVVADCLSKGGLVMFAGNGGSASQAQHAAAEIVGRFMAERPGWRAVALNTDSSVMTALANDYGYDRVFERQVEALGREGDVFIGLSTSGNSPNILKALEKAREMKLTTVAFTGPGGGKMSGLADHLIDVPEGPTFRIQELHLAMLHMLCAEVERILTDESK